MASTSLPTANNTAGQQVVTGTPQSTGSAANTNTLTPAGNVQPGTTVQPSTATNVLNGRVAGSLQVISPTKSNLSVAPSTAQVITPPAKRELNLPLLGLSLALCLIAIALFWYVRNVSKKHKQALLNN